MDDDLVLAIYDEYNDPIECSECGEILEYDPQESEKYGRRIYVCMACALMHTSDGRALEVDDDGGGDA